MTNNEPLVPNGLEPMCGWDWIRQHRHDLDGWKPTIEISRNGYKVKASSSNTKVLSQVTKIAMSN